MLDIDLGGKVAIVTGGSAGIGRAVATDLAKAGASVMICARRPDVLETTKREIESASPGARIETFVADAGKPDDAGACVAATVERLGSVDILVNNAPGTGRARLMDIDAATMDRMYRMSPVAVVTWSQAVWRASMEQKGGAIVNITAVAADRVERGLGFYGASKAAVARLTRQLAAELGPRVRVNAVSPGWIYTQSTQASFEKFDEGLSGMLPMRRLGQASDIADAVAFLASDLAAWITGATLVVDGGSLAAQGLLTRVVGE